MPGRKRSQDADKRFTWPYYQAGVRLRLRCGVALVVVATTKSLAQWCATPIDTGHPGTSLTPIVIGPEQVPVISQPEQARSYPELLVLSAIMHGKGPRGAQIARAAAPVLALFEPQKAPRYFDLLASSLSKLARAILEREMSDYYQFQTEWLRSAQENGIQQGLEQGLRQGRNEGLAEAVLKVLGARGIAVPAAWAAQVRGASEEQLGRWLTSAIAAHSLDEIFDE